MMLVSQELSPYQCVNVEMSPEHTNLGAIHDHSQHELDPTDQTQ